MHNLFDFASLPRGSHDFTSIFYLPKQGIRSLGSYCEHVAPGGAGVMTGQRTVAKASFDLRGTEGSHPACPSDESANSRSRRDQRYLGGVSMVMSLAPARQLGLRGVGKDGI